MRVPMSRAFQYTYPVDESRHVPQDDPTVAGDQVSTQSNPPVNNLNQPYFPQIPPPRFRLGHTQEFTAINRDNGDGLDEYIKFVDFEIDPQGGSAISGGGLQGKS